MGCDWINRIGLLLVLLSTIGCGARPGTAPTARVSGTVTYQGKPIEGVNIAFVPTSGRPASGVTDASGRFTLSTFGTGDGAVLGSHKVVLAEMPDDAQPMPGEPGWEKWKNRKLRFAKKYADPELSGFTAEVKSGTKNVFSFDMTSQSDTSKLNRP
jgi:hypothetical protein